jgi:hypothetical protein
VVDSALRAILDLGDIGIPPVTVPREREEKYGDRSAKQ